MADLNQAIGLLGIKPLKLLVLGFSLPDALFAEVAARELRWYWTNTLTRAVAARLLSEQLWHQPGDEAFIAGLLQDIGILVLMRELGAPWQFGTDDPASLIATWQAQQVVEPAVVGNLLKRWPSPAAPPGVPGVPRGYFVEARKP